MRRELLWTLMAFLALSACVPPPGESGTAAASAPRAFDPALGDAQVLIYAGASAWLAEVDSLHDILEAHGVHVGEISSAQLDSMSLDELASYRLMIFPGGDAITMTASLSAETHARLRAAVQTRGVGYLGFCAGAWAAVSPAPAAGKDVTYGFGIVDGPIQKSNYLTDAGREFAIARALFPHGVSRDLLWYGGPVTPEVPGGVIARYPDGTAAISQIRSGEGMVILSGLHPAATPAVLSLLGLTDTDGPDYDIAWTLLDAALSGKALDAF